MEQTTVTPTRRLERGDGPLGGVAAGLADYFSVDVTLVRLGLVATTLLGGPAIPIAYIAGWIIIPSADGPPPAPTASTAPAAPWTTAPPPPPPVPVPPAPAATPSPFQDPVAPQPNDSAPAVDEPAPAVDPASAVDAGEGEGERTESNETNEENDR